MQGKPDKPRVTTATATIPDGLARRAVSLARAAKRAGFDTTVITIAPSGIPIERALIVRVELPGKSRECDAAEPDG